jgi:hypothetical protein
MSHMRALAKLIVQPVERFFINRKIDSHILALTRQIPITEFADHDVFIVGYPKSGNTWFQNLVSGIVYGLDLDLVQDSLVQDLVPDVHYKRYYKRYRTPMYFKSHLLPRPDYKRIVYLLRDGRDAMVSYFSHLTALKETEIDFLRLVNGKGLFPCKWHEHVDAWLSNPYNAEMIVVKYEDLKKDTLNELKRFCAFVGIEKDDSSLQVVADKASFEKMHHREILYGWDNPRASTIRTFVRRGEVGSFKDEMPPKVLESFINDARETLRKCDYLTNA